jgi:membrane protein DedA with SNARE-associated domain
VGDFINSLTTLDPAWMYAGIFLAAYIENIFPPVPSDVAVVLAGALAAMERGHFILALFAGVTGSTLGFMTMYFVGRWFGTRVLDTGKIRFVSSESIQRMDAWFGKYGYWLIAGNRFLAGTRAIISFFAGLSKLDAKMTAVLSCISSILWYGILMYIGYALGDRWEDIKDVLTSYSETVTIAVTVLLLLLIGRLIYNRNKAKKADA